METFKERRKHKRFSVNERSCVLVSPIKVLSYKVLDISDAGIAFLYAGWENWPEKGIKLDIIDQEFCLEDIPVRVISDMSFDDGSDSLKMLRRCGVKFTRLNADQKQILQQYIESVATN
ncbi:MAG: hypothetical protein AMJ60_00070 [Desulfobacterales bacterium SG8_35]|nr:MAG: hypothetical protein AMJ60_00070 [Desulfobacterales bacterium SG8_35]